MRKYKVSVLSYAILSASILLSACGENTQKQTSSTSSSEENSMIVSEWATQATESSVHWLTPDLLVFPKSNESVIYQLINTGIGGFNAIMLSETDFPDHLAKSSHNLQTFKHIKST